ncbi:hypothetical protein ABW20_dc0104579 [Dactylellina cionopaga]|nr:hypothetical protein ABW20_dc0104579 [Dactylellina cionopaga]
MVFVFIVAGSVYAGVKLYKKGKEKRKEVEYDEIAQREIRALKDTMGTLNPPSYPDERPLRILSLDGGGVRGLSSLLILKQVLNREAPGVENPKPCDYFDMISGTSTGGIIAIMVSRLRMGVDDCIQIYKDLAKDVFGFHPLEKLARKVFDGTTKGLPVIPDLEKLVHSLETHSMYDAIVLNRAIKKHAGNKLMMDQHPHACKVFVVSVPTRNGGGEPKLFRTWGQEAATEGFKIWEALRATSAAPTYFKPIELQGTTYSDGGLGYNNPAMLTYLEAIKVYGEDFPIDYFVSIGTGVSAVTKIRDRLLPDLPLIPDLPISSRLFYFKDLMAFLTSVTTQTRRVHYEVEALLRPTNNYFRFDVENDLGSRVGLDRYDLMPQIEAETISYLNFPEVNNKVGILAKKIRDNN